MKLVFSLKSRAQSFFTRGFDWIEDVKVLMWMPFFIYLVAAILIFTGFNKAQSAIERLYYLSARARMLEKKLMKVRNADQEEKLFARTHKNISEDELKQYVNQVGQECLRMDLPANALKKGVESSVLKNAPQIRALIEKMGAQSMPVFKPAASSSKQKGGMLERQLKLEKKVSLQERAFYALIDGLERGLNEDSPSLLIKRWTISKGNSWGLELKNMHIIEREKIDHEK